VVGYVSTHSLGLNCLICHAVLVPDQCKCGNPHGFTFAKSDAWARTTFPDHPCFQSTEEGTDDRAR
jgi:hypothetical protein